jgi:hypothetical protein
VGQDGEVGRAGGRVVIEEDQPPRGVAVGDPPAGVGHLLGRNPPRRHQESEVARVLGGLALGVGQRHRPSHHAFQAELGAEFLAVHPERHGLVPLRAADAFAAVED